MTLDLVAAGAGFVFLFIALMLVIHSLSREPTAPSDQGNTPQAKPLAPQAAPQQIAPSTPTEPLFDAGFFAAVLGCVGYPLLVVGGLLGAIFLLVRFIKWAWTF